VGRANPESTAPAEIAVRIVDALEVEESIPLSAGVVSRRDLPESNVHAYSAGTSQPRNIEVKKFGSPAVIAAVVVIFDLSTSLGSRSSGIRSGHGKNEDTTPFIQQPKGTLEAPKPSIARA
jgi:hypothetical protein